MNIVIDKEVEIAKLANMLENLTDDKDKQSVRFAINVIEGFEERPTGEWLKSDIPESLLAKCSICGFDCGAYSHNFCPNCGADMRGEDNE